MKQFGREKLSGNLEQSLVNKRPNIDLETINLTTTTTTKSMKIRVQK